MENLKAMKARHKPGKPFSLWKTGTSQLVQRFGAFTGLFLLCVFFSLTSPHFLTTNNLLTVALQTSVIAIVAIGQTFVIIKSGIDLSVGSVVAISGVVAADLMTKGTPVAIAVLIGIGVGAVCGLINGFLIAFGKIPPFIATLGMMGAARGAALVITDGIPVSGLPASFGALAGAQLFGVIPSSVVIMLIIAIIMGLILSKSHFGRNIYAIGSNEEAAYLSGIPIKKTKMWVYVVSGLMSGIAGIVLTSRLVSAQPTAGNMYELDAIAAVVIGGASLMGGVGSILGTLIGAFVMGVLRNGLNLLNVSPFWQQIAIGGVVVLAVFIDNLRRKKG
jgi:ribose transport system permease protein